MITKKLFGTVSDNFNYGKEVYAYTLANDSIELTVMEYGATILRARVNTPAGWRDTVCGYDTLRSYEGAEGYLGAVVGRIGNRICRGKFTLDGVDYSLYVNNGVNHLHGGKRGFDKKLWTATVEGDAVTFSAVSPDGEEGFRGPHGVFFTNCENVVMKNYTIQRNGNFMHQLDNCRDILMENVTCLAGHDGIHLHHCTHTLIQSCRFITGDDCVAGINIKDLTVRNCEINTSCQAFRIGGHDILVEDCHIWGPGYYPHRKTVVQGRGVELPRTEGRHNIHALVYHFASTNFPSEIPYGNYVFRNCLVETVDRLMLYTADGGPLESGAYLSDMTFENVTFKGMLWPAQCVPGEKVPLTVTLKNCSVDFREETRECGYGLFAEGTENLRVVVEE